MLSVDSWPEPEIITLYNGREMKGPGATMANMLAHTLAACEDGCPFCAADRETEEVNK